MRKIGCSLVVFSLFVLLLWTGCAGSPAKEESQASAGGQAPAWVLELESVYPNDRYVAAVGYDKDRDQAEKKALANLIMVFGQSVQAEIQANSSYSKAVLNGSTVRIEDSKLQSAVKTSAELDTLIGVEIRDVWPDNTGSYYAVAVLEKATAVTLYTELLKANERVLDTLLTISAEERETFDGLARYELAATIADANDLYARILSQVGGTALPQGKGADYRLAAAEIKKAIPVQVTVQGDRSARIQGAFTGALNKQGIMSTGGRGSRYVLEVTLAMSPADIPQNANKFVRYTLDANLIDTRTKTVLLPFSQTDRVGKLTVSEAENQVFLVLEKSIGETYTKELADYLARLSQAQK
jgi:hypothetical protein